MPSCCAFFSISDAPAQSSPTAVTGTATSRPGQAVLNGTVNPNGLLTEYWFEHGPNLSLGSYTPTNWLAPGTNAVAVSNLLTGLLRGAPYHFRLFASNSLGQASGASVKFTAPAGTTIPSGATGGAQPIDLRQPSLELNYIICVLGGVYPSPGGTVDLPFLSEVRLFAGDFAPNGWLFCHGQFLNITQYEGLFSLIGTLYGGDGETTFRLPDLRGRTVVGSGVGTDGISRVVGQYDGINQITLTQSNLPAHNHLLPPPDSGSGYSGAGQPYPNMQPYLVMSAGIWRVGVFPYPDQFTSEPMLGQISFYASPHALNSPLPASGQLLPINQNQALFSLLLTNYGGNGQVNFALPNLNGRTPMNIGTGPGPNTWLLAQQSGVANPALNIEQLPPHTHSVTALGIDTASTGTNQPRAHLQPSLAMRYIIATNGSFPSRPGFAPDVSAAAAEVQMIGQINLFAGSFVPNGWAACDGQLLPISSHTALFSLLGTSFGGNGSTTFALPNLSARIPVGSSNGVCGASYGAQQSVLTAAQMPAHTHTVPTLDFDRWITSFGLNGSSASFESDTDGDGVKNGFEWATGTNPTNAASSSPLSIAASAATVQVQFPRNTNATDVRLTLQRTGGLTASNTWNGIVTNQLGAWQPPVAPVLLNETGGANPRNVTVTDSLTNLPSANYRLRVEWP